jgi:hypothetical protein
LICLEHWRVVGQQSYRQAPSSTCVALTDNDVNSWTLQPGEVSAISYYVQMHTYSSILSQRVGDVTSLAAGLGCLVGNGAASLRGATALSDCADAFRVSMSGVLLAGFEEAIGVALL